VIPVDSDSRRTKHALFATNWNLSGVAVDTFVNPSRHLRTYPSSVSSLAMVCSSRIHNARIPEDSAAIRVCQTLAIVPTLTVNYMK
jgi:hypothetical protein